MRTAMKTDLEVIALALQNILRNPNQYACLVISDATGVYDACEVRHLLARQAERLRRDFADHVDTEMQRHGACILDACEEYLENGGWTLGECFSYLDERGDKPAETLGSWRVELMKSWYVSKGGVLSGLVSE